MSMIIDILCQMIQEDKPKRKGHWFFLWRETSDEKMMFGPCFVFIFDYDLS